MEEFIKQAGVLVAVFFLISLAVETILESFRGLLAMFGIEVLKSKKSLEEAMDEVAEFLPDDQKDIARFEALVTIVETSSAKIEDVKKRIDRIRGDLASAVDPDGKLKVVDREKEWLAAMSSPIRKLIEAKESNRVFALRIISAVLGIGVSYAASIDVTAILAGMQSETIVDTTTRASATEMSSVIGYILAGLAAAGGSSFWHDQLDRIRSLKQTSESVAALGVSIRK